MLGISPDNFQHCGFKFQSNKKVKKSSQSTSQAKVAGCKNMSHHFCTQSRNILTSHDEPKTNIDEQLEEWIVKEERWSYIQAVQ